MPVVDTLGGRWVRSEQFDLNDHLLRVALPAPAGQRELEALAGDLASTPVSTGRPLWAFHLVEEYQGGSAIIVRIHHSYADGMALMQVLARLADPAASPAGDLGVGAQTATAATYSTAELASALIPDLLTQSVRKGAELIEKGVHYVMHPGEAGSATREMIGLAGEVARIGVLLADDPPTRLKRPLTGVKHAAWAEPLALEEVRTLARVLGCTINDVLIATLAGALGRYLDELHGDHTAGVTIRATVPVNLRSEGDAQMGFRQSLRPRVCRVAGRNAPSAAAAVCGAPVDAVTEGLIAGRWPLSGLLMLRGAVCLPRSKTRPSPSSAPRPVWWPRICVDRRSPSASAVPKCRNCYFGCRRAAA